jgi:hypothetical protein
VVDRETGDLDFFSRESAAVEPLSQALEAAASSAGIRVRRVQESPGFERMEMSRGRDRCGVDLGVDARLWPVQHTHIGPTVNDEELAADKTLALFGRAAPRDYIDVYALARRFGEQRLIELASTKDLGFTAAHLAGALDAFDRLDRDRFTVDDPDYERLRAWAHDWSRDLRRLGRDRGHEPPDLGL